MLQDFKSEIKVFLLVGIVAIVVSVGGIFLLREMTPAPIEQPMVAEEEIDTSNWQTYHNDEFGFEVKYPNDWEFEETEDGVKFRHSEKEYGFEGSPLGALVWISVQTIPQEHDSLESYAQGLFRPNYQDEMTELTLDGVKAVELSDYLRTETVLFSHGKLYTFYMANAGYPEISAAYDQILSTFRFVE